MKTFIPVSSNLINLVQIKFTCKYVYVRQYTFVTSDYIFVHILGFRVQGLINLQEILKSFCFYQSLLFGSTVTNCKTLDLILP